MDDPILDAANGLKDAIENVAFFRDKLIEYIEEDLGDKRRSCDIRNAFIVDLNVCETNLGNDEEGDDIRAFSFSQILDVKKRNVEKILEYYETKDK